MEKLFGLPEDTSMGMDFFAVNVCSCASDSCSCAGVCACDAPNPADETMTWKAPSDSLHNRANATMVSNRRY